MKKMIDKKMYNTETAVEIADFWNGLGPRDFDNESETLYLTKSGNWFLHGVGGPFTQYATCTGNMKSGSEKIIPLSIDKVIKWCELRDEYHVIEKYFPSHISEA